MKKLAIVLLAGLFAFALAACSSSASSSASSASSNARISAMGFAQKYTAVSDSPINDIENVGSNAFKGSSYGYTMSMVETKTTLTIEIENNGNYEGMKAPFIDAVKVFDSSQADAAGQLFDESVAQLDPAGEDVVTSIGDLQVFFSPQNDIEIGHVQIVKNY